MIVNKIFKNKKTGELKIRIPLYEINDWDEYIPETEEEYYKILGDLENES